MNAPSFRSAGGFAAALTLALASAPLPGQVLFNELMYHPPPAIPEDPSKEWLELYNAGTNAVDLTGWQLTKGVRFTFTNVNIPAGGYLVVAANLAVFQTNYPTVTNAVGDWVGKLGNNGETLQLVNALGQPVNTIAYASEGDWALRRAGDPYPGKTNWWSGWQWTTSANGAGKTLELLNASLTNDYGQNWAASLSDGGTPGRANSVATNHIAPILVDVRHLPAIPRSTNSVTVTARIVKEAGASATVSLFCRVDGAASFTSVPMLDDGAHGDGIAGDGVYGAVLGPQPDKTIIEFYVRAQDAAGRTRTWPGPSDDAGTQGANALYQVDDFGYAGTQPLYRFIIKAAEWNTWSSLMDNGAGGQFSDAQMNGSLVRVDGVGTETRYGVSIRNRGAGTRSAHPHNLHLAVPGDRPLQGISRLDFNTRTVHSQVAGKAIFSAADLLNSYGAPVQVRVNGNNLANASPSGGTDTYQFGSYFCFQPYDGDWAQAHVPLDPLGNLYKGVWYFDGIKLVHGADLDYLGTNVAAYEQLYSPTGPTANTGPYLKQSNVAEDDWSDLIHLVYVLSTNTPDSNYVQAVGQVLNIDQFLAYFAVNSLIVNMETTLATGVGDDYSMYRGIADPRFQALNHDLDTVLGQGDAAPDYARSIFKAADLPAVSRLLKHPQIAPRYYATLKTMADTIFAPAEVGAILDQNLGGWVPTTYIQSMKDAAAQRRTNVLSQIPLYLSVSSSAAFTNGYYRTTTPSITLFGRANAINTRVVLVNNSTSTWSAWQARWTNTVALQPGLNRVLLQALDDSGAEFERASVDVWYDPGTVTVVAGGTLAANTSWPAANGPYRLTGNLTIPAGLVLTIGPGATVYCDSGVGFIVNGQLLAQGTDLQRIRFTRQPGATGTWAGFQFVSAHQSNVLAYADIAYGDSRGLCIYIKDSQVLLERDTFFNMTSKYLDVWEPQVSIRHSVFGDLGGAYFATIEHMLSNGWFVVEGNLFGRDTGDNDIFHLNRVSVKGGPVAQILNNVFTGAGDDIIDDNETDTHIEGNLFMNFTTNHPARSASAAVTTGEGGSTGTPNLTTQHLTVVRNIFWGQDYGILNKDGSYVQVYNSVFVNNRGAIIFDEPWRTNAGTTYSGPGRACYIESSIFWQNWPENGDDQGTFAYLTNQWAYRTLAQYRGATQVKVNNSILPAQYHYLGTGNLDVDPRFVFGTNNLSLSPTNPAFATGFDGFDANTFLFTNHLIPDVHLLPGSPALKTGFNGSDMGPYVPTDATLSGQPASPTAQTNATLTAAGLDVCGYKYRLIGPGFTNAWSPELQQLKSVTQIILSGTTATATVPSHGYANGDVIEVLGADSLCPYFNGTFTIGGVTPDTFSYTVVLGTNAPMNELPPKDIWCRKPQVIQLTGLSNGTYTLQAIRKNSIGVWQEQNDPTSVTWTLDTLGRRLFINELLADNRNAVPIDDTSPDLIELYNPSAMAIDLAGLGLTDDPLNPGKFTFSAGFAIGAGQYAVLIADNNPGTNHTGFALNKHGGGLYLFDSPAQGRALLDSVTYGIQLPDLSIGRLPTGGWGLTRPTFGAANVALLTGDVYRLRINEWLAASAANPDFVELFNADALPVDLGGCYLTDEPVTWPERNRVPPLSFIAGNGLLAFTADGTTNSGADHLNFRLAHEWGALALFAPDLDLIDQVFYGPQTADVSMGRTPNGADQLAFFPTPTPGSGNPGSLGSCTVSNYTVHLMSYTQLWKYNQTNNLDAVNWTATNYNDSWPSGQGLLAFENNAAIVPLIKTTLNDPRVPPPGLTPGHAYYFRTSLNVTSDLSPFTITATYRCDDGAVLYLNGSELRRIRMAPGVTITNQSLATGFPPDPTGGSDATVDETITFPGSALLPGQNIIAASVHQQNTNSSDIVWGLALDATLAVTNCVQNNPVLNEVMAHNHSLTNADGSVTDWVELYNPSTTAIPMAGMSLTDDPAQPQRWVFPSGITLAPGAYLIVRFDQTSPASTNSGPVLNAAFGLDADGDKVLLYSGAVLLDAVTFGLQAQDFTIGRVPNGTGPWVLTLPSAGTPNLAATLGNAAALRINEWMADPKAGDDWFELYNPNPQPVTLTGLALTDDLTRPAQYPIPTLSFIGAGPYGAYVEFHADGSPTKGASHTNFKLAAGGESIGIFALDTAAEIDAVTFGLQTTGVSEGFFPDGSTNLVRFARTPTPGSANYLPFTDVLINEALSRPATGPQAIELFNQTEQTVDLSGCWLSDDLLDLKKFRLPDPTILPPGAFLVLDETQFNAVPGRAPSFALDPVNGGTLFLGLADPAGNLTGYRTSVQFGGADSGLAFGQYEASTGPEFVAMTAPTFGAANPAPRVGPVVINEIHYHPPDIGTNDNVGEEFIELLNITGAPVPLFDPARPTNTWHLRNAVSYDFPTNTTLPAGGYLLAVSFDPATNSAATAAFRMKFSIPTLTPLFGPWRGKLANGGETIELNKPSDPVNGLIPRVLVEGITYANTAPWPSAADGSGSGTGISLQRKVAGAFGNDPVNWVAATPSSGTVNNPAGGVPPSLTTQPVGALVPPGGSVTFTAAASGAVPLCFQWRLNGLDLLDATNATLSLTNVSYIDAGRYSVRVSNPWGCVLSADANLRLQAAPTISRAPLGGVANGAPFIFTVVARGTAPLAYQWRFNGGDLVGATDTQLLLPSPQPSQSGDYCVVVANAYGSLTSAVASLSVTIADSDADGLPDWWMLQYFGHPTGLMADNSLAYLDADHDGLSNLQEYWAGTSPVDAASALRVEAVSALNGNVRLSFTAVAGHTYTVQWHDAPATGPWQKLSDVPAAETNRTVWVTNSLSAGSQRFYRLVTPKQN